MKKILLLLVSVILYNCTPSVKKEYESNKAIAQKWVQAFETNNLDLWKEAVSEDLKDQSPLYGAGVLDYNASLNVAEFYINNYRDIRFTKAIWLPGIDTINLKPDGSVRAYGTWTGISNSTGRTFANPAYHTFNFKNGKIITSGEYFDASGMISAVGPGPFDKTRNLLENISNNAINKSFRYPKGTPSITVRNVVLEPGQEVKTHTHPFPVVVTILKGEMTVEYESGEKNITKAGESFVGVTNKWHKAKNTGNEPLVAIGTFLGEKGKKIMIMKE
tara:strand:- start:218 stop:1042 length:825 start_codon:yes stop_codon:yes gene_type:complete